MLVAVVRVQRRAGADRVGADPRPLVDQFSCAHHEKAIEGGLSAESIRSSPAEAPHFRGLPRDSMLTTPPPPTQRVTSSTL